MPTDFFHSSRRSIATLTILSFFFSQASPVWASPESVKGRADRQEALRGPQPEKGTPAHAGLEAALTAEEILASAAANQGNPSLSNSLRHRGLWIPVASFSSGVQGPVVNPVPGVERSEYIIEGIFAGDPTVAVVRVFDNPLRLEGADVAEVLRIVERGKRNPTPLKDLELVIFNKVDNLIKHWRNNLAGLVHHLEREARSGRHANAAIAVAALRELGCFCGHFSYPGTQKPLRGPIRDHETLQVEHLEPLLDVVRQKRLETVFQETRDIFVSEDTDFKEEAGRIQVRFRQVRQGSVGEPGEWVALEQGTETRLLEGYRRQERTVADLEQRYKKTRTPGNKRRLDRGRARLVQARRQLLQAVVRRIRGPQAVFRNYVLEDYLGNEGRLREYFDLAWGFKRFDQFVRVVRSPELQQRLRHFASSLSALAKEEDAAIVRARRDRIFRSPEDLYAMRIRLSMLRDIAWTIEREVLGSVQQMRQIVRDPDTLQKLTSEQVSQLPERTLHELYMLVQTLRSMDRRMETRGRDSLGLVAEFTFAQAAEFENFYNHVLTEEERVDFDRRQSIPDFLNGSIVVRRGAKSDGTDDPTKPVTVTFAFKTAMLVGRLGDNVARLTGHITSDRILQRIFRQVESLKLIHTRWASSGIISEPNTHPVTNRGIYSIQVDGQTKQVEMIMQIASDRIAPRYGRNGNIFVALNGDIDNYDRWVLQGTQFFPNLKEEYETRPLEEGIQRAISENVTTDAEIIPDTIEEFLARGLSLEQAVRQATNRFAGSFAIQVMSDLEPDKVIVARGGDGQGLYIGISDDGFIPASEQLGFVDLTQRFVRVEPVEVKEAGGRRKVPVYAVIDRQLPPTLENLRMYRADTGQRIPITEDNVEVTESTTRDVDLGDNPFFFVKEVFESPEMFETTIEGRVSVVQDPTGQRRAQIRLGEDQLPEEVRKRFRGEEKYQKVHVIGMGTSNAAGLVGARIIKRYLDKAGFTGEVKGVLATEEGKFDIPSDMSDTLIIAISQSGGTKETNSALDEARKRGATIVAVVNKRDSDMVFIARDSGGGVYYTGTGRETEIAVASTKAYYAQIGALAVLGMGMAELLGLPGSDPILVADAEELLAIPDKMREWFSDVPNGVPLPGVDDEQRERVLEHPIVKAARFWPLRKGEKVIVGDGIAYEAAEEIRIKNSELTYMAIGRDYVTHPKHINLSAEPWILVLAANIKGQVGNWWQDYLLNQLQNYVAHKAAPIVIATQEEVNQYLLDSKGKPRYSVEWTSVNGQKKNRPMDIITVPETPEHFAPIPLVMGGHLFAYHTALAINELSVLVGQGRERVTRAWVERIGKGMKGEEIVEEAAFRVIVREAFAPFLGALDDDVILPGIRPGLIRRFLDMVHILSGQGHFESTVNYGGEMVPFMEAFAAYGERLRIELSRSIDAIRHQAKFVTVGVQTGGEVVVEEIEHFVRQLADRHFSQEVVGAALGLYLRYRLDGRPQVQVIPHPYEGHRQSQVVFVVKKVQPRILDPVTVAARRWQANVIGDVHLVEMDQRVVGVVTLDKPVEDLRIVSQAGLEDRSLERDVRDQFLFVELGVDRRVGNWLVTRDGALIRAPGTTMGVNLIHIHPTAKLAPGVRLVGEGTVVEENAQIGEGTYVENAKVRKNATVGAGSILIHRPDETEEWRLSPHEPTMVARSQPTEVGEGAQLGKATYLFNFRVGPGSIWRSFGTYPNVGMHGEMGRNVRATTAKIVLAKVGDDSVVGNFEGSFEEAGLTGPIEVTDFVGRPGERIGQAGRSRLHYVEYVEGFSLTPMVARDPKTWAQNRVYRELPFMSTRVVRGDRSIALEFSGTLKPTQTKVSRITGWEDSGHGILAFGFGGVMGGASKLIGTLDSWTREDIRDTADVLGRYDRTYLGHFAILAPRGFEYREATGLRRQVVAKGEGWGRIGNFSLRGDLSAREEVPAWTLDHAVDVILTQMAEEFQRLRESGLWEDADVQRQFNTFIQDAILTEILELQGEKERLQKRLDALDEKDPVQKRRRDQYAQRMDLVNHGILRLREHHDSGTWGGEGVEWGIRQEDGQPAFGGWWREQGRWIDHTGSYKGYADSQYTIEELVATQPGHEHPSQEWYPTVTDSDWRALMGLFQKPGKGSTSPTAQVDGIVDPSAVIRDRATIKEGAIIGPGVVVGEDAFVDSGANLAYTSVGSGSRIGSRADLYGVITEPGTVVDSDSRIRLSIVGSKGESPQSKVGKETDMFLAKVQDGSVLGDRNELIGSMIVKDSRLGNDNQVIYGRLENVQAGNHNTLNSLMRDMRLGNNSRNDHLSSSLQGEIVEPIRIALADGRSAEIHPVVTHGAYITTQGELEARPVRVRGSFLAGLTVVGEGVTLDRSFAKLTVAPRENLLLDFSAGPGEENTSIAGVLERNGPSFILRFMLSYPLKNTPEGDRWAVGYLVEDAAVRSIQQTLTRLRDEAISPLAEEVSRPIRQLLELVQEDFLEAGSADDIVRGRRAELVGSSLEQLAPLIQTETKAAAGEYSLRLELLQGLRRAVTALDGRYRLRYSPEEEVLLFTEGVWDYDPKVGQFEPGEYTWVPTPLPPVSPPAQRPPMAPAEPTVPPAPPAVTPPGVPPVRPTPPPQPVGFPTTLGPHRQAVEMLRAELVEEVLQQFNPEEPEILFRHRYLPEANVTVLVVMGETNQPGLIGAVSGPLTGINILDDGPVEDHGDISYFVAQGQVPQEVLDSIADQIRSIVPLHFDRQMRNADPLLTLEDIEVLHLAYGTVRQRGGFDVRVSVSPYNESHSRITVALQDLPPNDPRREQVMDSIRRALQARRRSVLGALLDTVYRGVWLLQLTVDNREGSATVRGAMEEIEGALRQLTAAGLEQEPARLAPAPVALPTPARSGLVPVATTTARVSPLNSVEVWTQVNLLPQLHFTPEILEEPGTFGIIAGPADDRALAAGVALSRRSIGPNREPVPVVFIVTEDYQFQGLIALGVSTESIIRVDPAGKYKTVDSAVNEATAWLKELWKVNRVVPLGVTDPVPLLVLGIFRNVLGVRTIDDQILKAWQQRIDDVYRFLQA